MDVRNPVAASGGTSTPTLVRRQVAGRCSFPAFSRNFDNSTAQYVQFQQVLTLGPFTEDIEDLAFTWQNAYRDSVGDTDPIGLTNCTIRAGIWDGVNTYPLYWHNGSRDLALEPGAIATTAPQPVRFAKGQRAWLVYRITYPSAPAVIPCGNVIANYTYDVSEASTTTLGTDRTTSYSGGMSTRTLGNFAPLPPIAVTATAPSRKPVVAILGDSIASDGSNDYNSDDPDYGWAAGGLGDAGIPYVQLGQAGLKMADISGSAKLRSQLLRAILAAGATHLLVTLATNDWSVAQTAAQVYAGYQLLKTELAPLGIKVVVCTVQPRTNAANTGANSGDTTTFTQRPLLNAQVIANNGVGHGYFDVAAATQDTVNTNLWRTDVRAAADITIANGGTGFTAAVNDLFWLPGGGMVAVNAVSGGAATGLSTGKRLGGWLVDPAGPVGFVRRFSRSKDAQGLPSAGTGITFNYGTTSAQSPTADGTHPNSALTTYIRQQFAAAAPNLFAIT